MTNLSTQTKKTVQYTMKPAIYLLQRNQHTAYNVHLKFIVVQNKLLFSTLMCEFKELLFIICDFMVKMFITVSDHLTTYKSSSTIKVPLIQKPALLNNLPPQFSYIFTLKTPQFLTYLFLLVFPWI